MISTDKLIYLDLHKTGSAFVDSVLKQISGYAEMGRHKPMQKNPNNKVVIATIRNPYDWYVSIWAYGCQNKGVLKWSLTATRLEICRTMLKQVFLRRRPLTEALKIIWLHRGKDHRFWRRVYSDAANTSNFKEWLFALHSQSGRRLTGTPFAGLPMTGLAGFMTCRMLYVYSFSDRWNSDAASLNSDQQIERFFRDDLAVQRFLKAETLSVDLAAVLKETHPEFDFQSTRFAAGERVNTSTRSSTANYFDQQSYELVSNLDSLIFNHFDYEIEGQQG